MNEPEDLQARQLTSSGRVDWSDAAFLAVAAAALAIWFFVDGPAVDEPDWLWFGHVVLSVVFCLCMVWTAWSSWTQRRRELQANHEAHAAQSQWGAKFEWLWFLVIFSIVWKLVALAIHAICHVIEFDVDKNSAVVNDIEILTTVCVGFPVFQMLRRITSKRQRSDITSVF